MSGTTANSIHHLADFRLCRVARTEKHQAMRRAQSFLSEARAVYAQAPSSLT